MRRWLVIVVSAVLMASVSGGVQAVEKKKNPSDTSSVTDKKQPAKRPDSAQQQPKAEPQKKYDNFVDENGNGIDDRRENLKKKKTDQPKKTKDKSKQAQP